MDLADGNLSEFHYILWNCTRDEVERASDTKQLKDLITILRTANLEKRDIHKIKQQIKRLSGSSSADNPFAGQGIQGIVTQKGAGRGR